MGLARYNLFCLPPAGLSESREATVGREVYLNYADRTDGRAGAKGGSKAPPHLRESRQEVLERNEAAETSENKSNLELQEQ